MRADSRVRENMDMTGSVRLPNCPKEFRVVAERILTMLLELGYSIGYYRDMSDLDKKLAVDYWVHFDGLPNSPAEFREWYTHATNATDIARAKRWLVEKNYIILPEPILKNAQQSAENYRRSIKGKR